MIPAKSYLGLISKVKLDRINNRIRQKTNANQSRNPVNVIEWIIRIKKNKNDNMLLMFGIVDFYPSMSETLLMLSLDHAKQFTEVSDEDLDIITHAKIPIIQQ